MLRNCTPLVAICMLAGCATLPGARARGGVAVIAHRGASAYAPENTIASFKRASELGADWFELDTQLSADGKLVVIHDTTLDRTTGTQGKVWDQTLAAMQALDAGSWIAPEFAGERLPSLEQALDFAKGRIGVYIEIKSSDDDSDLEEELFAAAEGKTRLTPELRQQLMDLVHQSGTRNLALTQKVIAAVRERDMQHEVVLQSFSPAACLVAATDAPGIRLEILASRDKKRPGRFEKVLHFGYLLGVDGFNLNEASITPELVEEFHHKRKTTAVWTVDDPETMRKLASWGVDAIITNKPDVALDALRAAGVSR